MRVLALFILLVFVDRSNSLQCNQCYDILIEGVTDDQKEKFDKSMSGVRSSAAFQACDRSVNSTGTRTTCADGVTQCLTIETVGQFNKIEIELTYQVCDEVDTTGKSKAGCDDMERLYDDCEFSSNPLKIARFFIASMFNECEESRCSEDNCNVPEAESEEESGALGRYLGFPVIFTLLLTVSNY